MITPESTPKSKSSDEASLDQVMLAMDVVDTLRHEQEQVLRELNEEERDRALVTRVREIYQDQGIEVSEEVVAQGVEAMKKDRLTYRPPPRTIAVRLAEIWVDRKRWSVAVVGGILALWLVLWIVRVPERARRARDQETEQASILGSKRAETEARRILASLDLGFAPGNLPEEVAREAASLRGRVVQALAGGQNDLALQGAKDVDRLVRPYSEAYDVRVVAHADGVSGVERTSTQDPNVKLHYLIVESRTSDGKPWEVEVRDEATGVSRRVATFGLRVPKGVFDRVRADKLDNRIVDDALVGQKLRGQGGVNWLVTTEGGMILSW